MSLHRRLAPSMLVACVLSLIVCDNALRAARAQTPRVGTAAIAGRIVSDEQPDRPVPHATVTLAGETIRPGIEIVADADGRFAFTDLPAGRFTLTAAKPAYLTSSHGQTTPGEGAGVEIALADGERLANVPLRLPRGAVIAGRVLDHHGLPAADATIVLLRRGSSTTRGGWQATGDVRPRTDAAGMYRAYGLRAGEYVVSVYPPGNYRVILPESPFFPNESATQPADAREIDWAIAQLRAGASTTAAREPAPAPAARVAYGVTHHPDAVDLADASTVTVRNGEEREGVDVRMSLRPTTRIAGRLVGPDGQPVSGYTMSIGSTSSTRGTSDGTFAIDHVLPGHYSIGLSSRGSGTSTMVEITVDGTSVPEMVVTLQPSPTVSGHVTIGRAVEGAPKNPEAFGIALAALPPATHASESARVGADGRFTISPVLPGRYRLALTSSGPPSQDVTWPIATATIGGRDAFDVPFEIAAGQSVANVSVALTRAAELTGTIVDSAGAVVPGAYVALIPRDAAYRVRGSRRAPSAVRADTTGKFRIPRVPAADYYVIAAPAALDVHDEAAVSRLLPAAALLTLREGPNTVERLALTR